MNYGLIGWPLGHSISPFIHQELFKLIKSEGNYELFPTPPEELEQRVKELGDRLEGFNVTVPHKTAVLPLLEQVDESALLYGGANTLKCLGDGRLRGCNTDIVGVRKALESVGLSFQGRVCVLGSGATSGLLAMEAALKGCEVTVALRPSSWQRGMELAERIADQTGRRISLVTHEELSGNFDLLLNGTIAGMYPNGHECPVSPDFLGHVGGVFDAVYNPSPTLLIQHALERGIPAAGGLVMLVWQAAAAQTYWHGIEFDPGEVNKIVEQCRIYIHNQFGQ